MFNGVNDSVHVGDSQHNIDKRIGESYHIIIESVIISEGLLVEGDGHSHHVESKVGEETDKIYLISHLYFI